MKVLVTTPYEKNSLQGNTVTALRIVAILSEAGFDAVVVSNGEAVEYADIIIALHARKSAHFIDEFLERNPVGKVIVYLTGTDLYRDIPNKCGICEKSMQLANVLVVSQDASLSSVPERFRSKALVVHKSIQLPDELSDLIHETDRELFTVVGHLRAEKQPFMAVEAFQLLGDSSRLKLVLLGKEIDDDSGEIARNWQNRDHRFQWLGGLDHSEAIGWIKRSVATINTSIMEGGANSVGESIMLGVPVLASRIEGNVGMLGNDYLGYFDPNSRQELANLIQQVISDTHFLERLRAQVSARRYKFSRENEKQGWLNIIQKLS